MSWLRKKKLALDPSTFVITERLFLRPPIPTDADDIGASMSDAVLEWQGWLPEHRAACMQAVSSGFRGSMHVLFLDPVGVIGVIDPAPLDENGLSRNIGFWMSDQFSGRGYMTEALIGLIPWLHDDGADVLTALTAVENSRSRAVLTNAGFECLGASGPHTLPNGVVVDSVSYQRWLHPTIG